MLIKPQPIPDWVASRLQAAGLAVLESLLSDQRDSAQWLPFRSFNIIASSSRFVQQCGVTG